MRDARSSVAGEAAHPVSRPVLAVLLAIGVGVLLTACKLEAIGFGSGLVPFYLYLGLFCLAMSWLSWGLCERDWPRALRGVLWLAMLASSHWFVLEIRPSQVQESEARAAGIASALADYRARNGRYPTALDGLVPDYLKQVPPTAMGLLVDWEYRYSVRESGDYALRFYVSGANYRERGASGVWRRGR